MTPGVSYWVEWLDTTTGDWVHWDSGGNTLSTTERRAKDCARRSKSVSRIMRAKVEDDWKPVELSRFVPDPSLKSGARRA